jgi:hypothetical protein
MYGCGWATQAASGGWFCTVFRSASHRFIAGVDARHVAIATDGGVKIVLGWRFVVGERVWRY